MGEASNNQNFVQGDQFNAVGDQFIGNQNVNVTRIEAERAYDVRGLPNPYLGLRSYTYSDRAIFAGRERYVAEAVRLLTAPSAEGSPPTLMFVTGASGSGKSSFVQAGLVPAVAEFYTKRGMNVRYAVFRPGGQPLTTFADALIQLGLAPGLASDVQDKVASPVALADFVAVNTPPQQINLLLIDQFEEVFTQSQPQQAAAFLDLIEHLPPIAQLRGHIIATMRVDYLPSLFLTKPLYDIAKRGVDLRAMTADELEVAIQRPVQQLYPNKRFEPALVTRLAEDAAQDASYLPLMQVTLEQLWKEGSLKLSEYRELTASIQEQAEDVYNFTDYAGAMQRTRSGADKAAIMEIMLDLVQVSPDQDFGDVRHPRERGELVRDSAARERLIDDLLTARLLSARSGAAQGSVIIDIIHESLIKNWTRLQAAIKGQRQQLESRERFERALADWEASDRKDDYLLTSLRLAEAKELRDAGDVAMQSVSARELVVLSITAQEEEQERQLKLARDAVTAARSRALILRRAVVIASLLLVAAIFTSVLAFFSAGREHAALEDSRVANQLAEVAKQTAVAQSTVAADERQNAFAQATIADIAKGTAEAETTRADAEKRNAEAKATQAEQSRQEAVFAQGNEAIANATAEAERRNANQQSNIADAQYLSSFAQSQLAEGHSRTGLLLGYEAVARDVNQLSTSELLDALSQNLAARTIISDVTGMTVSPDGQHIATSGSDNQLRIWDITGTLVTSLTLAGSGAANVSFSPDSQLLAFYQADTAPTLYNIATRTRASLAVTATQLLAFSADSQRIIAVGGGGVGLWGRDGQYISTLADPPRSATHAWFSPDSQLILTAHPLSIDPNDEGSKLWSRDGQLITPISGTLNFDLADIASPFSPDSQFFLTLDFTAIQNDGSREVDFVTPDTKRQSGNKLYVWDKAGKSVIGMSNDQHLVAAQFSPDSQSILTLADNDNDAVLWQRDGLMLARLRGHNANISGAAFSPDGSRILTYAEDGTARLWDNAGRSITVLRQFRNAPLGLAHFSNDSSTIITAPALAKMTGGLGQSDFTARLWHADGSAIANLQHDGAVRDASFLSDHRHILTLANDPTDDAAVTLWDLAGSGLLNAAEQSSGGYSPDGTRLLTTSYNPTENTSETVLWGKGGQIITHTHNTVPAQGVSDSLMRDNFAPDGSRYVTTATTQTLLLDRDGKLLATLSQGEPVIHTYFSSDGSRLITEGRSQSKLWNNVGTALATLNGTNIKLGNDGSRILSLDAGRALLYDNAGRLLATLNDDSPITNYAFSPQGSRIVTLTGGETAKLWDADGKLVATLEHGSTIYETTAFAPDDSRLVTTTDDLAKLWSSDGKQLASLALTPGLNQPVFAADGSRFILIGDTQIILADHDGKPLATISHSSQPDAQLGYAHTVIFSPDSHYLLTPSGDYSIKVWNMDGKPVGALKGHTFTINFVAYATDGQHILSTAGDNSVRLWDSSGNALAVFTAQSAEFSPDGKRILLTKRIAGSGNNLLQEYPINPDDDKAIAACLPNRALNEAERKQFGLDEPAALTTETPTTLALTSTLTATPRPTLSSPTATKAATSTPSSDATPASNINQSPFGAPRFDISKRTCPPPLDWQKLKLRLTLLFA